MRALAGLLLLAVLAGCASRGDSDVDRSAPPARAAEERRAAEAAAERDRAEPTPPPPREISTDRAHAEDPGAGTASRRSSQQLVEEGKGYLIASQPGEAARRLERATRVDPTNGFAWYHLGRARVALGDRSGAIGVLQKAESLLGPYPQSRAAAARLLAQLGG